MQSVTPGRIPCWWLAKPANLARYVEERRPQPLRDGSLGYLWCRNWNTPCAAGACIVQKDRSRGSAEARGVGAHRKPPPLPYVQLHRPGSCGWCGAPTLEPDGTVSKRRSWHDGRAGDPADCSVEHARHTRAADQLAFLIKRDGPRCAGCRGLFGSWVDRRERHPDALRAKDPWWAKVLPAEVYVGVYSAVTWDSPLQVDHVTPLGLVPLDLPAPERWRFFGPENLQALCLGCHRVKTREDRRLIAAAGGAPRKPPSWAR